MTPDFILALVGLGITLLTTQAAAIIWVISYVERAIRAERENADRVYAMREHVARLDTKLNQIGRTVGAIDRFLRTKLGGHEHDDRDEGEEK